MSISDRIREGIEDVLVDYGNEREDAAYSHRVRPDLAGSVDKIMALLAPAPLREEWATADSFGDVDYCCGYDDRASVEEDGRPIVRRYVTGWAPATDRAEGDGSTET